MSLYMRTYIFYIANLRLVDMYSECCPFVLKKKNKKKLLLQSPNKI